MQLDRRIDKINQLVTAFSQGRFAMRLNVDDRNDELNACMWSFNILGEELETIAITRDYFNAIFNTIDEMVMVITSKGLLDDVNLAVSDQLGYRKDQLIGQSVDLVAGPGAFQLFRKTGKQALGRRFVRLERQVFITAGGSQFPVDLTLKFVDKDPPQLSKGILLTAKNATDRINAENRVLRAVIDALEQERLRLARDLHDSVGQQLAASRLLVNAAANECGSAEQARKLAAAKLSLDQAQAEIRNVCFEIAPRTLAELGLLPALRELSDHIEQATGTRFKLFCSNGFPALPRSMEIDLFRIAQEFAHNAIRHGAATVIKLALTLGDETVGLQLNDNGYGFDPDHPPGTGMGLQNIKTRVQSHAGQLGLSSAPGATDLRVTMPLMVEPDKKS